MKYFNKQRGLRLQLLWKITGLEALQSFLEAIHAEFKF